MTVLEKIKRCVSLVWDFQEIYGEEDIEDFCRNELHTYPQYNEILDYFKRIAELEHQLTHRNCVDCSNHSSKLRMRTLELEKENAELKEKVSFLEDNLRVARKDREDLQLDVAKGLKEFVKDYPATALRYLANEKYVEQLSKAKELIKKLVHEFYYICELYNFATDYECLAEAEQFLKDNEVEK